MKLTETAGFYKPGSDALLAHLPASPLLHCPQDSPETAEKILARMLEGMESPDYTEEVDNEVRDKKEATAEAKDLNTNTSNTGEDVPDQVRAVGVGLLA